MAGSSKVKGDSGRGRGHGVVVPSASRATQAQGTTAEDRCKMIAAAAYFRAEERGFAPGHEVEDWLAAEREVDEALQGDGLMERLRTERDELRVRVHLARLELRQEWDALERKWDQVRTKSGGALRDVRGAGREVGTAAGALLGEIREGYKRIRAAL
jgi:hypothetical protein